VQDAPAAVPAWLLLLHVLGAVVYGGGLVALTRLLVALCKAEDPARTALATAGRKAYLMATFPGSLVLFATGLYMLLGDPAGKAYMKQGYMHVKLTLIVLLLVVDQVLVMRPFKRISKGTWSGDLPKAGGMFLAAHLACLVCLAGILTALYVLRDAG
ncbi:MAG: CopD family protein, partial [Planctomycetota bacterium]